MGKPITVAQLQGMLAAGESVPVVVLLGEEAMLRRGALETLTAPFLDEAGRAAAGSIVALDGAEVTLAEVLDEARSLPLFAMGRGGPSRLVRVGRFDLVETSDATPLERYLAEPVGETRLVLEADKLDKRKAIYKALARAAVIVECEAPKREADARAWVEATARAAGFRIERAAVVYLIEMAGTSLTRLEQELAKAMSFAGEASTIRARDLEGLLGRSREHSVFELTDALVRGNANDATRVLNMLVDDGEEPLRILAMVAWITRQLVIAADLAARGTDRKAILDRLGGRWTQRGEILDRARGASPEGLLSALASCADADLFVKRVRGARAGADRLGPARGRLEALCRQICAA